MKMEMFPINIFIVLLLAVTGLGENATFKVCGNENSEDVISVINSTVDRLMELRHPTWGWTNTPQVVLGLQLSAQNKFFGRDESLTQMEKEINAEFATMNIGKLALYVMAVQSTCGNPRAFGGRNLVKILDHRIKKQFRYNGKAQLVPYDRYYRFGLALGALCVNKQEARNWVVAKLLKGQNMDGSFGDVHSVDDAGQILLALNCVKTENRSRVLKQNVSRAIDKLVSFLLSKVTEDGSDVWIGNKFSTPSSVLGLMMEDSISWSCGKVMRSLAVNPKPLEKEGGFSQRLPALAGDSYLDLIDDWKCQDTVPIPLNYQPTCDPSNPRTCSPTTATTASIPYTPINVRLTIFTDSPPSVGNISNADVTVTVQNGSTLYDAMVKARDDGQIMFESKTTSWGESIKSMQGVERDSDAHQYWSLINGATGLSLSRGVSSYVPVDGEQIVFRLKTW